MGYDIYLKDQITREVLKLDEPHFVRGGQYAIGGTCELHLYATYNYASHFERIASTQGIRAIYGMTGAESIPLLKSVAGTLADDVDGDYWKPTEGNAKRALLQLVALAQMRPDGVWDGD
jgi:hypothetical protein